MIKLIDEATGLDPHNLEIFYRWIQASYEALEFDVPPQQRFDEYCRAPDDSPYIRLLVGPWMLRQSLHSQGEPRASDGKPGARDENLHSNG